MGIDKKFDAALILSNQLNPDGSLSDYCRSRLETAANLYRESKTSLIAVSGYDSLPMEKYLLDRGFPKENVLSEAHAVETVGNAIFLKHLLAIPRLWTNLAVVSSNFHMERVKEIFDFVFPPQNFDMTYISAMHPCVEEDYVHEEDSLKIFKKTFEGIKPGDDFGILQRILERHGAYQDEYYQNLIQGLIRRLNNEDVVSNKLALAAG